MDSNRIKHEVVLTTNTSGWDYIVKLGQKTIEQMERDAIDEEDDVKGNSLRREAKAARKFFNDFMTRVNLARQLTETSNDSDGVWEMCM